MNKLDFVETMKILLTKFDERKSSVVDFYDWTIYFDENFSKVKIRGVIPYEVAMRIFENYPCEKLDIMAGAIGVGANPLPFLKDIAYENDLNRRGPKEETATCRMGKSRFDLKHRSPSGKYIDTYRVSSKEGLIVILGELKNYYAEINDNCVSKSEDLGEIIAKVNANVLDKIDPRISGHSWMQYTMNSLDYMEGWNKFNENSSLREFRRALEEFDRTINPFIEGNLTTLEIAQDLKGMRISTYPFDYSGEYKNETKFYRVHISDVEDISSVEFGINPAGFLYSFDCKFGEKDFFLVQHFYNYKSNENDKGEILVINYFGDNSIRKKRMVLNLTSGTICADGKIKKAVTELQLASIYLDLVKATRLAADITVNNFTKNKTINFLKTSASES